MSWVIRRIERLPSAGTDKPPRYLAANEDGRRAIGRCEKADPGDLWWELERGSLVVKFEDEVDAVAWVLKRLEQREDGLETHWAAWSFTVVPCPW